MIVKSLFRYLAKSLGLRVSILSTLWVLLALIALSIVSIIFYRQSNDQSLESILTAQLYSLISAVSLSEEGYLQGKPELGDVRYLDASSGWYYDVTPLSSGVMGRITSPSLGTKKIDAMSEKQDPFDDKFFRSYTSIGPDGQKLLVVENDVILDNINNRAARFRIMGNIDETREQLRQFKDTLLIYLWTLGILSVLINIIIIRFSLRPLKQIGRTLARIRQGDADHVDTDLPLEVLPLAYEMNALIDNNFRIIERSRTQVGNLAHSLKTPLSIIANALEEKKSSQTFLISEQIQIMQRQIDHYLTRARIAAQRDSVVYQTPVRPVIERMVRVMKKLYPEKTFEVSFSKDEIIFIGEQEDLEEMIGNLLENAGKWANSHIVLACRYLAKTSNETIMFSISVSDDGLGLAEPQRYEAIKRGKRLDETKPGTGLGLSIVADMSGEYGGDMSLEESPLGGLTVKILLPCSQLK
ncbi:ATP-binding protein [Bartonella tamiae]|uniref:histidine kinase n=1 Tax=Bartonella tamiae Th239 TaxID=1094558 RepID=J1K0M2_9HYPH|nr:ATP-binding protein [Bartonella tamiae]EJF90580.1 hypothetical protein ME5_00981 [Bartonella tamiae Th239]EJF94042.1 hypothetical protein MEG_00900 [Bartonella tamiae Th307]